MAARFAHRISRAQQMMVDQGLDLLLVTRRENLIYFTGVTQIECMSLIIPRRGEAFAVTLWLDRVFVERESGLRTYGYHFPCESLVGKTIEQIKTAGYTEPRIGFERYFVDFPVYDGLRSAFPERGFVGAADIFYRLRSVKEPGEIELIRQASKTVCAGMEAATRAVRPGVRELDVLAEAEYAMLKAGSGGSPFRPQVVSGERTLLTHPTASNKIIAAGEVVVIHLGATCEGYCSKICHTVAVGDIPVAQAEAYQILLEAQGQALAALRPGATAGEVDAAARNVVARAGYERSFLEHVGYGVGLRQSEFYPIIGKDRPEVIEAGMVVDLLLPTVYRSGVGGPRVTDVIHVGAERNEILTDFPRELIRL